MAETKPTAVMSPPASWAELSWEEKREQRFERWLSPRGIEFNSTDAAQGYRARLTRIIQTIRMQEPDRVPCLLPTGQFPARYAGTTLRTVMYDYEELKRAWRKVQRDFDPDTCLSPSPKRASPKRE